VIEPPSAQADSVIPSRYAIAFFAHPNRDTWVEPLDVLVTAEKPKQFEGVYAGKHVVDRLAALHKAGKNLENWDEGTQRKTEVTASVVVAA
jgi:isopenicillin N synthase-like dioxygenase